MPVPKRTAYVLYQWLWSSLDWFYPPKCGGCGNPGTRWCETCQAEVMLIAPPVCECCGEPLKTAGMCRKCSQARPAYHALRSWAAFQGPLRGAMHHLKYMRDVAMGEILARPLAKQLEENQWMVDAVVPVPMSKKHLSARGYNQAALLAKPLALATGLAYRPTWIYKTRETQSQVGLSLVHRKENVAGAFEAASKPVRGNSILLVDDVSTTGATLESCTKALFAAGARDVYCLTLARAI